jgi:small subunit ribosomal protein S13
MEKKDAKDAKPQKNPKQGKPPEAKKPVVEIDLRALVRVSGVVLDGNKKMYRILPDITGLGQATVNSMLAIMGIDRNTRLGSLDEAGIENLENSIRDVNKMLPVWMLNRRKDYNTGEDMHLIGAELEFVEREDVNRQKKIRTYRGMRHTIGQPVRGQRTRTSFRTGAAVGVSRKKTLAAAASAAAPAAAPAAGKPSAKPAAKPPAEKKA